MNKEVLHKRVIRIGKRNVIVLTHAEPSNAPESAPDLAHMTKAQLIELAEGRGLEVTTRMTKAALVGAIEGAS